MKRARDFREEARVCMYGKRGALAVIYLVYLAILWACSMIALMPVFGGVLGTLCSFLVTGPLSLGGAVLCLNVLYGEKVEVKVLFSGFNRFVEGVIAALLIFVFVFLWSLLLVIPGIIKSLSYSMTYFILAENPDISANEARKLSMSLMHGNKWRLFCLLFSFIGWAMLCALTLGILTLWVVPYMYVSVAAFYKDVSCQCAASEDNIGVADAAKEKDDTSAGENAADGGKAI